MQVCTCTKHQCCKYISIHFGLTKIKISLKEKPHTIFSYTEHIMVTRIHHHFSICGVEGRRTSAFSVQFELTPLLGTTEYY